MCYIPSPARLGVTRTLQPFHIARCWVASSDAFRTIGIGMNIMLKASFSTTQPNYQDRLKQYYYHNHSRHPNGSTNKESLPLNYNSLKEAPEDGASSTVPKDTMLHFEIPQRTRQKFISAEDAVALVRDGDTVCVSGFVSQGAPEAVLKALGERYENTSSPNNLSLLFGGGPGDWDKRGLNHLAKKKVASCPMLKRVIGSHYGQVPVIAELALSNEIEAWTLPLGSISRMIRAQSTHSPGHITNIGIGTYVDPSMSGGAANEAALQSELHKKLISRIKIDDQDNLMYKALPINVAIIRGTTADSQGNITVEHESLLCDQKITAAAANNSGGIVIAQVKRIAANGSLLSREVAVPGPLVDCVVVVDEQDHDRLHPMSYEERYNPALTGMIKTPQDEIKRIPLDIRKIIARRAFFALKPDKIVNLGIGLPEGLASVASEEGMLEYITMSTEPGVFGGFPVSGRSFGPAINASALVEMNQMFDFYDGGGLNMCFLGAAQVSERGDVNVSRMSKNRLTGPGGFIDISQSTRNICFMTPLTTKDLKIFLPGDGTLKIEKEGSVKKFLPEVLEKTFSGDEAVRRGQKVFYVTERAVFRRTAKNEILELVEIAPGIDLVKDVLDQLDFTPVVSPDLMIMDPRIFKEATMNVKVELFGSIEERCRYHSGDHTMYLDLFGITLNSKDDVKYFVDALRKTFRPLVRKKGKIDMVVNYDGFDLRKGLEDDYSKAVTSMEHDFYKSTKRFTGSTFRRAKLAKQLRMSEWDTDALYDEIDTNQDSQISLEQLRTAIFRMFQIKLTPSHMNLFQRSPDDTTVDRETFGKAVEELLKDTN